jgi:hypothetical protein
VLSFQTVSATPLCYNACVSVHTSGHRAGMLMLKTPKGKRKCVAAVSAADAVGDDAAAKEEIDDNDS